MLYYVAISPFRVGIIEFLLFFIFLPNSHLSIYCKLACFFDFRVVLSLTETSETNLFQLSLMSSTNFVNTDNFNDLLNFSFHLLLFNFRKLLTV